MNAWDYILIWVGFLFVSVAASQLAVIFPKIKLPLITGYLFIGIFSGPYVLNFLEKSDLQKLAPLNQFVLAFIGFSAGAELYLPELRDLFKSIFLSVGAISVLTYTVVTLGVRLLITAGVASFTNFDPPLTSGCKTGIAMLIGAIMTARSPASAIAIVKELRAKGPFTRCFLGVTVVSDVVVLVLFAVSVAYARGQCSGDGFSGESILTLLASLTLAVVLGYFVLGKLIVLLLYLKPHWKVAPKWLVLPIGFGIFKLSEFIADKTLDGIGHEINLEPLLMTIVAGYPITIFLRIKTLTIFRYVATNQSRNRRMFLSMLQKVGPLMITIYVFIPFFTLTGASLDLSVLSALLAVITCILRMISIALGSFAGGFLAKAPKRHTQFMWLSLITQAGVSLGLAGEINFMFHDTFGPACATAIVAVIMLNQIAGPILCKIAIKKVGEDGKAKGSDDEEGKGILILGINGYSLALAERLRSAHWKVTMAEFRLIIASMDPAKLPHALRLNGTASHEQVSETKAVQKKKKMGRYQTLEEELEDQALEQQGSINNDPNAKDATAAHGATPAKSDVHVEEHDVIHDVIALTINDLDKSQVPEADAMITKWNFRELAKGMDPKNDVVLCMLETDNANSAACSFYKLNMKFVRIIGACNAPVAYEMYLRAGAYPFYAFSSSINVLYQYVTAHHLHAAHLAAVIQPEAESFPQNIELLPHLRPIPDEDADSVEIDLNAPSNLLEMEIEGPSDGQFSSNPLARLGRGMRDSFTTTGARLRELRDPVGLVQRGVSQMQVVPDEQRDEYLDSIEGLGDGTTKPLTANSLWMDLLAPEQSQNSRRVDEVYADRSTVRNSFRTDMSVFEQYQDMEGTKSPPGNK